MPLFGTSFSDDCRNIREQSPIVHNITNYVAMNFSANALLALGASPVMSSEPLEMTEIAAACTSAVINIGCLESLQIKAMEIAASEMYRLSKPWVLDPVGAGLSRLRLDTALDLAKRFHPSVIRGNASEIMALSGEKSAARGVDTAQDSLVAEEAAKRLASATGAVVSVSGKVDLITDGTRCVRILNGSPMMPAVTAMGCTASAVTAAFLAVDGNPLRAASLAMAVMGVAGERAAAVSRGTGSFAVNFIDALSRIDPENDSELIRYE